MDNLFDFSGVESTATEMTSGTSYLKPGMYNLKPLEAKYSEVGDNKTSKMTITFECISDNSEYNGAKCEGKFWVTPKDYNMQRLQYLHEGLEGTLLSQKVNSAEQLVDYFNQLCSKHSNATYKMAAGGSIDNNGKLWSDFPSTGYFVTDENFNEGAIEINGPHWKGYINGKNKEYTPNQDIPTDQGTDDSMFH